MLKNLTLDIKKEYLEYFKEREDEISGALLAVMSGEHILLLGPPGTAKTLMASKICEAIEGGNFFYYLLTRFSTPEELFGPLSLKALENDEFKRKVEGCLPTAHIALLDEIFKANSSILNSLLTVLNEKKFHNGKEIINTPLVSVFGASNELPEEDESLEALYDRFLFRYSVNYVQHKQNFNELVFDETEDFEPSTKLNLNQVNELRKNAKNLPVDQDVKVIIDDLREELQASNIFISDRRWKKIVNVLRVASAANGNESVNRFMLILLQHMLWDRPEQKETIRKMVLDRIASGTINAQKLKKDVEDLNKVVQDSLSKEELPVTIYCNNCYEKQEMQKQKAGHVFGAFKRTEKTNLSFKNFIDLLNHYTENKDHLYKMSEYSYDTLQFEDLILYLVQQYDYEPKIELIEKDKKLYMKEYQELNTRYQQFKKQVNDEKQVLNERLGDNIWISGQDLREVLLKFDINNSDADEIKNELKQIQSALEINKMPDINMDEIIARAKNSMPSMGSW